MSVPPLGGGGPPDGGGSPNDRRHRCGGAATLPLSARRGGPLRNPPRSRGEGEVGAGSGEGRNEGGMANIHVLFLTNRTGKNIVMKAKRMPPLSRERCPYSGNGIPC